MATERRLIDYYAVMSQIEKLNMDAFRRLDKASSSAYRKVGDILMDAPTIEAVEVVRCKDCKHREDGECPMEQFYPWLDQEDTDFCSRGERRTDNG